MAEKMLGMELVGTANALRRLTFQDSCAGKAGEDSPTSMQQWFLAYIWEHHQSEDVFQKDLEAAFKIRRSTATQILKAMERSAVAVCKENQRKISRTEELLMRGLSQDEIKVFFNVLQKIQRNIELF